MKVRVLNMELEKKAVEVKKTDTKEFQKYLNQGYHVTKRRDGFFTLRKRSKILVTVELNRVQKVVNLKRIVAEFYGKGKIDEIFKKFNDDLKSGRIVLEADSNGYISIIEK